MEAITEGNKMKQIEVVAAIIQKGDKIFATQRGYGEWKDWWEFPGGKMEVGETPRQKGKRGEKLVAQVLSQLPEEYVILNDVVLPTTSGTTQIDHIVVSKYGVFTIETKNYRGDIYGDDNRQEWTQLIVTEVTYAVPCHLFQLTKSDFRILKSQIVTSKPIERRGGTQKPPYAFTRNGIGMLSSVLRSGYVAPLHHTSLGCFLAKRGFF